MADPRRVSMTREVCEGCSSPYLRAAESDAVLCCGCALGYATGKSPSWQALGSRPVERRGGGGGVRRSEISVRTCTTCGNQFNGVKVVCYPCRERARHKLGYEERTKMRLDSQRISA